jgi:endoglucanase
MTQISGRPLGLSLLLALAGCGGGGGSEPSSSTPVQIPATPAPALTTPVAEVAPVPVVTEGARRFPPIRRASATRGLSLPIGRCMNVEYDDKWRRPVADADYGWFRRSGFDTIRLPVRFAKMTGTAAPYTIDPTYLAEIRRVTDIAVRADLNIIIDLHNYAKDFAADPEGQRPRFIAMWRQIADAFKDADPRIWFELLNEPQPPMTNAYLTALYNDVIPIIRRTNPTRPIIVNSQDGSASYGLASFELPDDPYVVPTVHTYEPNSFTFQYDPYYTKGPVPTGLSFGSDADWRALERQRDRIAAFMARTGTVPFVGEYGAYQDIPLAERINYLDAASNSFASLGIGTCVWAYSSGFALRDDKGWLPGIIDAIAKPLG